MLATSSRQQAVLYKRAVDDYLAEQGYAWKAVVAFSGTVTIEDEKTKLKEEFTEAGMNGFPETQTAAKFETDPYRLLIVANKFQTGFDQPLLHTMYVDKLLSGLNAVQTLSRLNRTLPPLKTETCILDFADNAERVKEGFARYYGQTTLAEVADPNELYTIESGLKKYGFYFAADLDAFAAAFYKPRAVMEKVYAALKPVVDRVAEGEEADQREFRGQLKRYADLYAFLGQVIPFADPGTGAALSVLPLPAAAPAGAAGGPAAGVAELRRREHGPSGAGRRGNRSRRSRARAFSSITRRALGAASRRNSSSRCRRS